MATLWAGAHLPAAAYMSTACSASAVLALACGQKVQKSYNSLAEAAAISMAWCQ